MNLIFGILLLSGFSQRQDSVVSTYYHHSQSCHVFYAIDYHWKLELKNDSGFVLTRIISESRGYKPELKTNSKNKKTKTRLPEKTETSFLTGRWKQKNDTLTLSPSFSFPISNEIESRQLEFQVQSKSIKSISDSIRYFPKEMELIEPERKRNH